MEAKSLIALYRMSQPALAQEGDKGLMLIDRDGDLFLKSYGINDEFKNNSFRKTICLRIRLLMPKSYLF